VGTRERVAVFASKFEQLNIKRDLFFVSIEVRSRGILVGCGCVVRCRLGPSAYPHFSSVERMGRKEGNEGETRPLE